MVTMFITVVLVVCCFQMPSLVRCGCGEGTRADVEACLIAELKSSRKSNVVSEPAGGSAVAASSGTEASQQEQTDRCNCKCDEVQSINFDPCLTTISIVLTVVFAFVGIGIALVCCCCEVKQKRDDSRKVRFSVKFKNNTNKSGAAPDSSIANCAVEN